MFELLFVVGILAIVAIFIVRFATGCSDNGSTAEDEARKYAKSLGLEIKGVSCTERDSDGDGYVSCSISHNENGSVAIMPVECAIKWSANSGCKSQKIGIQRRQNLF
jgi:hypothetical protein